eukprot:3296358-Prymnesium_polylepis.1
MKQQWIDTIKKNEWQENPAPNFQGTTNNVTEVGEEFVKLYKTIFSQKHIDQRQSGKKSETGGTQTNTKTKQTGLRRTVR